MAEAEWWDEGGVHVRSVDDGQRGILIERGGQKMVRLDRASQTIEVPYNERKWQMEREGRPLTPAQSASVAFEADKALCFTFGQYEESRRDWQSLSDSERLDFIKRGPEDNVRFGLWVAIMRYLREVRR